MLSTAPQLLDRVQARRELPSPSVQRALRKAAGASLAEVADAVGVTRQAVSMWELGQRSPRSGNLPAYLEVLRGFRRAVVNDVAPKSASPASRAQGSRDLLDSD
jgi:transcriptional regulator with XRE-family HTH domain